KPNIEPIIFEVILRYIYSGVLEITNLTVEQILKLLIACDELCIQDLFDSLQSHIIHEHPKWIRKNLVMIYQTCFHHSSLTKLLQHLFDLVTKNSKILFDSPEFLHLNEPELVFILQQKELMSSMSEGRKWDHVLRWGISQHSELPTSLVKWKTQDFEKLQCTLAKCVSLINFNDIGAKEFYQKVQPYAFLLDVSTYQRVHLKHLSTSHSIWKSRSEMAYNAIPQMIDSLILNDEQAKLISSWISKDSFSTRMVKRFSEVILRSSKRNVSARRLRQINQVRLRENDEFVVIDGINNSDNSGRIGNANKYRSHVNRRERPMSAIYASSMRIDDTISERERPMSAVFSGDFNYSSISTLNSYQPYFDNESSSRGYKGGDTRNSLPISTVTSTSTNDYEFRLLLRGSRDGFSPAVFHELCDNQGPTLCVFKLSGSGKILGGYNPLHWKSANPRVYESSIDGFLFSFDHCTVINTNIPNYDRADRSNHCSDHKTSNCYDGISNSKNKTTVSSNNNNHRKLNPSFSSLSTIISSPESPDSTSSFSPMDPPSSINNCPSNFYDTTPTLYYYAMNPKQSIKNYKLHRAKENHNTIRQYQHGGPNFFCLRLCSNNKVKYYHKKYYTPPLHEEGSFDVEEYEVFKVIKIGNE
ncbi:1784_t:CDS:2, partial [Acaulospora morrowiae]